MHYNIRMLTERLIGIPVHNSIESRIFNTVSIIIAIALSINAFFNYVFGLYLLAMLMLFTSAIAVGLYYISRIKKNLKLAVLLFGLIGNAVFTVNFYYNSGIEGPTILIFILLLFLLIAISPKQLHFFWMILNSSVVLVLLTVSYYYPQLIKNSYLTRFDRFADLIYSYLVIIWLIGSVTVYIKNTYNQQRILLVNKAEQLTNVSQTKDKLLSIIAHDLRSPLASIQNYLEILNEFKFSEEEKKRMEQELLMKTKNTDQLLSNLLYWSMNQMNGVKVKLTTLNLKETLTPVLDISEVAAQDKGIEIANMLPDVVYLIADKDMLQIMVRNLISNAIKFTLPGGQVKISCSLENKQYKIMISDNGVGIPLDQQASIFSLKTNSTYGTKQEKGTGLGLVLCKEFAELQNGTIGFESNNGAGTTFYFKLKIANEQKSTLNEINQNNPGSTIITSVS
ncbi:MAG: HAMP domain-containing histidine kinase [Sphingobacteriaceae bacterium]|nr:MAG: HAMP domain-containing histidine kinase [Sphingobacteriaceae bacterium]